MSKEDRQAADVVIAGGGFVGLACALALAGPGDGQTGLEVIVIDAEAPGGRAHDPRASAVTAASRRMLMQLGAWGDLDEHAQAVAEMDICDARLDAVAHVPHLVFDTGAGAEDGSPAAYIVENDKLLHGLKKAVAGHPAIGWRAPARATGFSVTGHSVEVACDGSEGGLAARLLVAADGARSALRAAAGIKTVEWDYGQWGMVATIRLERDHRGVAVQHFLPSGPFAMLPLRDRRASLVWSEQAAAARRLLALDEPDFIAELERRLGRQYGKLALEGAAQGFPLSFLSARSLVGDRFALAGDAAHRFHPLAGQGVNMGFKDAAALAEVVLDAARLGQDIGSAGVLERYQTWRRFDAASLGVVTDGLNRLFSNDADALRFVRDTGLGLVDRMPFLKTGIVREAAGDLGELPRLMRGEPI